MRAAQRVGFRNRLGPPAFAPVILLAGLISDSGWLVLGWTRALPPPPDRWNGAGLPCTPTDDLLDTAQLGPGSDLPSRALTRGATGCSRSGRAKKPCPVKK